jgi:CTP:molybdopterin cytidylyltransferase MocA
VVAGREREAEPVGQAAKQVIGRHRHEAVVVDWPEGARRDIDVPADYDRVRTGLKTN